MSANLQKARPQVFVLTGHVDRLALFAPLLTDVQDSSAARERGLLGVTGRVDGADVTVVGTGMGGPATARAVDLARSCGAAVVVRAGGAGVVTTTVGTGDHVIATAAVRDEGASRAYLPDEWPAVAHPDVVDGLEAAAARAGLDVAVGVIHTKDSFYGEIDPASSPVADGLRERWSAWRRLGVLVSEMEAATLFAAASRFGLKAGAILRVNDVVGETGGLRTEERQLCEVAVQGAVRAALQGAPDDGQRGLS